MDTLNKLLTIERSIIQDNNVSNKQLLQHISALLSETSDSLDAQDLFASFIKREKLGSTYIGHGIALPHVRASNIKKPYGCIIRLKTGISFNSNNENADIFFGFIVPENDPDTHLNILALLAEKFDSSTTRDQLRNAKNSSELYEAITQ